MEQLSKKVRIVEYRPHFVRVEYLDSGEIVKLNRKFFEKRLSLGLMDPINPEVLPTVF